MMNQGVRRLPVYNYLFVEEMPFENLQNYSLHRRLMHYQNDNHFCAKCGIECHRLIWGQSKDGARHLDLYNADLTVMLTLGHIIPISRGGSKKFTNIRPLCYSCNQKEGNFFDHFFYDSSLFITHLYGKQVERLSKNPFQDGSKTAKIVRIFKSENDNKIYFGFVGGFTHPANKCKILA